MATVFDIDPQLLVLFSRSFSRIRDRLASKRRIRIRKKAHRAGDLEQKPSIRLDQLPDPLIREAHVIDFVGKDVLQDFRRSLIPNRSPDLPQSTKQVHLTSLKGAVLNGKPSGQRVAHVRDCPFEIPNREFTLISAELPQP